MSIKHVDKVLCYDCCMQPQLIKGKILEDDVKQDVMRYLDLKSIFWWKNATGKYKRGNRWLAYGHLGSPDILAIYPGVYSCGVGEGLLWLCELKKPGGLLSDEQIDFLYKGFKAGAIVTVAESVDDIVKQLTTLEPVMHERYFKAFEAAGYKMR